MGWKVPADFLAAAEPYRTLGWAVFPMSRDKRPLCKNGFKDATTDIKQHERWARQFKDCNIAVATGRISGVIVLDVDGDEGEHSLAALADDGLVFPTSPQARTGRGRHIYMKYDRHMKSSVSRFGPNLDIRSDGGSAILPPSIHHSGKPYSWDSDPLQHPLQHFPLAGLLRLYQPKVRVRRVAIHQYDLAELANRVASAQPGTRNNELNSAAYMAGRLVREGKVSEQEAISAMAQAGIAAGLPKREAETTAKSGVQAGWEL